MLSGKLMLVIRSGRHGRTWVAVSMRSSSHPGRGLQPLVERVNCLHHVLYPEGVTNERLAAAAHFPPKQRSRGQLENAVSELAVIARGDEEAGLPVQAHFTSPIGIVGNDR